MKHMIAEMAAAMTRMKSLIRHMFDTYEQSLKELSGTPDYVYLFEPCMMM